MADETRRGRDPIGRGAQAALLTLLLLLLAYQLPATHAVDVGGYDAAYVQGFFDPEPPAADGTTARYSRAESALLFPQIGLPATLTIRARTRPGVISQELRLLAGGQELGRMRLGAGWSEQRFTVGAGLLKPEDVAITLQTTPGALHDGRLAGVLLDSATLRVGGLPVTPYPAQLLFGALAAALIVALLPLRLALRRGAPLTVAAVLTLLWLLLYRWQPLYPFPLRGLLAGICLVCGGLLAARDGPALARRWPWALDVLAIGGVAAWLAALLLAARGHLVLSTPGVENDFRVFALRSAHWQGVFAPDGLYSAAQDGVLRADGFYNLGYPLLLWLLRPLTQDNPFLAGRLIAALAGALLLLAGWWTARSLIGRGAALLALAALALSPFVVQYALYLGTDGPFVAVCGLTLALLVAWSRPPTTDHRPPTVLFAAGLAAGCAFLLRHPGLLLLPVGALVVAWRPAPARWRVLGLFLAGWLLAVSPQLYVNLRDTGQPLFNQQAKNIWLAVYGDGDWGRWGQTANGVSLLRVVAQDPARFLASWWANLRAYVGTGAEDTSEFGRAIQLRLLGFPANWLALVGLLLWLNDALRRRGRLPAWPLVWGALYIAAVCVGFALPRFFLPLAPLYALGLGYLVNRGHALRAGARASRGGNAADRRFARVIAPLPPERAAASAAPRPPSRATASAPERASASTAPVILALILTALLWPGFSVGSEYVLRERSGAAPGQPASEQAAAALVLQTLGPNDRLVLRAESDDGRNLGKYSAIAHFVVTAESADLAELQRAGAQYLLQPSSLAAPPGLRTAGAAGAYSLYRLP